MKRKVVIVLLYIIIFISSVCMAGVIVGPDNCWRGYIAVNNFLLKNKNIDNKLVISSSNISNITAKTSGSGFKVLKNDKWEDMYVKGVNIGAALPGKWFTEFPKQQEIYLGWFEKIGNMNANCIRIYTLLPPEFYRAFDIYNNNHKDRPLWLLQEIWPEENPESQDYLKSSYVKEYYKEIEHVIDAVHGKANISVRQGRAYGAYTSDVSKFVLGYLVGRELEPDEVIRTNENNKGFSFKGEYVGTEDGASPSESWLAMNCDYAIKYEENKYNWQHPVAIVSWPTLDVQQHDSEWNKEGDKSKEYNDKVSIDINRFVTGNKMKSGFFGAYHIYPNYPDFMNNEAKYNSFTDENGRLRYGGYLKEFMEKHKKYPALVAEFGLPTGMGNAHTSPDGYNHGGMTEDEQGKGIVRMMKTIKNEGYAGGLVFEWMDEWAKKTWITEQFMIPYERHNLWHNELDPEQNYGLLAMESKTPEKADYIKNGNGLIKEISIKHDSTYLYMDLKLKKELDFKSQRLMLGIDTYDRNKGEFKYLPKTEYNAPSGLEFMIDMNSSEGSKIVANPAYNKAKNKFASIKSSTGIFEEINHLINNKRITKDGNNIEEEYFNESKLKYGDFNGNSHNHWYNEGSVVQVRIPWGTLNFTDPSSLIVIDDNRDIERAGRDAINTTKTDGILVTALLLDRKDNKKIDMLNTDVPYTWNEWNEVSYVERLKASYYIVKDYFGKLD